MEPMTIFSATVAFIGIFHLLSSAVNALGKSRNMRMSNYNQKRSDWYCFFKMSDLVGKETKPVQDNQTELDNFFNDIRDREKREQEARRLRLYV